MSCYLAANFTSAFLLDRHTARRQGRAADCSTIVSTLHLPRHRLMRSSTIYRSFNLHRKKNCSRAFETDLDNFIEKNYGEFSHIQIRNTIDLHALWIIISLLGRSMPNLHLLRFFFSENTNQAI